MLRPQRVDLFSPIVVFTIEGESAKRAGARKGDPQTGAEKEDEENGGTER
jgi:hypothetical protein